LRDAVAFVSSRSVFRAGFFGMTGASVSGLAGGD
jgi:hypothetical protein